MMRSLARVPATLTLIVVIIAAGIVWQGLWRPFAESPVFDVVAYGLPALSEGRWWTPVTGTFFVDPPWVYILTIAGFAGMGYLEFRRGSRVALLYFTIGQLFAVLASALLLLVLSQTPWDWAQEQARVLDVGPSGGTMACIAAATGLLAQPWRVRGWLVLLGFVTVTLLFWGSLSDLEHAVAVLLILFVDRSLRVRRTTIREQRLIAFLAALALGAITLLTLLVPTDGLFGATAPVQGPWLDAILDVAVALFFADGLRRGRRWAWAWTVGYAILNVVVALALIALLVTGAGDLETDFGDWSVSVATSTRWLLFLVYLIWVRGSFRARPRAGLGETPAPTVDEVRDDIRRFGGGTLSWMATWDGNEYARTRHGLVAYQRRSGVAIVLADPLGPEASRAASVAEFIGAAEHAGLIPCFFSACEATRAAVPADWRSLAVADDTIVDLPGLTFTGKRWNSVRTSLNRAGREDMTFRMTRLADEPWGIQQQLRAISEMWVGDKGLPEMGFTLGTLEEAHDPEVRIALAISPKGDVDGFLSWLPVYAGDAKVRGWTLDLMRRREGGFGPVMEYLIGASARYFSEEGAQIMSLSGAPLTHPYPEDAGPLADLTDRLAEILEPVYGFRSLHRFKDKFHPRYETMYLLFRDEADLTRIVAGLTRAFLPDATLRQFASAGLELVRSDRD
jgi:lysylphosphatidylglycerol synthetase-like protein (DUF2156 family)